MPTEAFHVLDYLDMRVAEGAPRSTLSCSKASFAFFEHLTGVEDKDKVSVKSLVVNGHKEVLLRAAQGGPPTGTTPPLEAVVVLGVIHLE